MSLSPRVIGLLSLAALVPLSVYLVDSGQADLTSAALTAVNVGLIAITLFLLFGHSSESPDNGAAH